jgi:tRNA uridine 5-carboxymethylaminomethyl modification enzyme
MRHDNADRRLCGIGRDLGLISGGRWRALNDEWRAVDEARERLSSVKIPVSETVNSVLREAGSAPITEPVTAMEILKRPEVSWQVLSRICDAGADSATGRHLEIEARYGGYIERESRRVRRMSSMELLRIPESLSYADIPGLSEEAADKLSRTVPRTLGQASRVPGVNNTDIQLVQVMIERLRGRSA